MRTVFFVVNIGNLVLESVFVGHYITVGQHDVLLIAAVTIAGLSAAILTLLFVARST